MTPANGPAGSGRLAGEILGPPRNNGAKSTGML